MTEAVTRDQMADEMEEKGNASVEERLGASWRRVNVLMADQGSSAFSGLADFHIFEQSIHGKMRGLIETAAEDGDRLDVIKVPGSLHFLPSRNHLDCELTGRHALQQVLIDNSIFREAAQAIAPGDPDALHPLAFAGIFDRRLKVLADALLDEARTPSAGSDLYAEAVASQMAVLILRRRYGAPKATPRRRMLSNAEIGRVTDHLEADLAEPGGMDTLAALLDMDVFAFTRAFKETTGQAPHQYLIDRRMTRIKDLLLHSPDSLAEIAYATGFSSQSHMTHAFRRRMGVSPGRWRNVARDSAKAAA